MIFCVRMSTSDFWERAGSEILAHRRAMEYAELTLDEAIKELSQQELLPRELHVILGELAIHSDREAAIVGSALVEAALEASICSHFATISRDNLSSFSKQIGYAEKNDFVPESIIADLKGVSLIRNAFSHAPQALTFEEESIKARCEAFRTQTIDGIVEALASFGVRPERRPGPSWLSVVDLEGRGLRAPLSRADSGKAIFLNVVKLTWYALYVISKKGSLHS